MARPSTYPIAILCLIVGVLLLTQAWIIDVTAPAPRPHSLLDFTVPHVADVGVDAIPARPGKAGYVEVWVHGLNTNDVRPLIHIFGTPALPMQAPRRVVPRQLA